MVERTLGGRLDLVALLDYKATEQGGLLLWQIRRCCLHCTGTLRSCAVVSSSAPAQKLQSRASSLYAAVIKGAMPSAWHRHTSEAHF